MKIKYKNNQLEKVCTNNSAAKRKYGFRMAAELNTCIRALEAADSVETLLKFNICRCHPLSNDRDGQYAMDLVHPYRLVFIKDDDGKIHIVKIIEIVDYH